MVKAITFDFDGVIGNTYQIHFKICQEIFKSLTEKEFIDYHKGNVFRSKIMVWNPQKLQYFNKKQKEEFTKKHLFPLKNVIKKLSQNCQLFIISSSIDTNIKHFLKLGKLDQYFKQIYGAKTHRSKVKKFKMIFGQHNLKADECLFVTDTVGDIKEAGKVKIKTIAVTWGYHSTELLKEQKPDFLAEKPTDLLKIIS